MLKRTAFATLALALTLPLEALAQPAYGLSITLATADRCLQAAEAESAKNNLLMSIAVVDTGGHLVALRKMDNTQLGSIQISIDKARSAVLFRRSTKVWEDAVAGGRNAILGLNGAVPIEGGLPLVVDGKVIGAVGLSGGSAAQDGQMAKACADALAK